MVHHEPGASHHHDAEERGALDVEGADDQRKQGELNPDRAEAGKLAGRKLAGNGRGDGGGGPVGAHGGWTG